MRLCHPTNCIYSLWLFRHAAQVTRLNLYTDVCAYIFICAQLISCALNAVEGPDINDEAKRGIIPRIVHTIFEYVLAAPEALEFVIKVSYMEIYLERIRDLFDGVPLSVLWSCVITLGALSAL